MYWEAELIFVRRKLNSIDWNRIDQLQQIYNYLNQLFYLQDLLDTRTQWHFLEYYVFLHLRARLFHAWPALQLNVMSFIENWNFGHIIGKAKNENCFCFMQNHSPSKVCSYCLFLVLVFQYVSFSFRWFSGFLICLFINCICYANVT